MVIGLLAVTFAVSAFIALFGYLRASAERDAAIAERDELAEVVRLEHEVMVLIAGRRDAPGGRSVRRAA